jgi:tetratricopeptide (TPR) repeat protein
MKIFYKILYKTRIHKIQKNIFKYYSTKIDDIENEEISKLINEKNSELLEEKILLKINTSPTINEKTIKSLYEKLIQINPKIEYHINFSEFLIQKTRYDLLLTLCQTSKTNQEDWKHKYNGMAYFHLSDYKNSIQEFNKYLRTDPKSDILLLRSMSHFYIGNFSDALFDINEYIRYHETKPMFDYKAMIYKSTILLKLNEIEECKKNLDCSILKYPKIPDFYLSRSLLFFDLDERENSKNDIVFAKNLIDDENGFILIKSNIEMIYYYHNLFLS